MPAITFRVFVAIAGVLTGLGAFVLACQALTLALVNGLGPVSGLMVSAAILASIASLAFWFVRRPSPQVEAETEDAKSAAADVITGLPAEALSALVRKHPLAVSLAAVTLGYSLIREPGRAIRQVQSMLLGVL